MYGNGVGGGAVANISRNNGVGMWAKETAHNANWAKMGAGQKRLKAIGQTFIGRKGNLKHVILGCVLL